VVEPADDRLGSAGQMFEGLCGADVGETSQQFRQHDAHLDACQLLAYALVGAETE
jgi:hypothetical protein